MVITIVLYFYWSNIALVACYLLLAGNPCSPNSQPLELTGYTGIITSHNYPNDYENNADCQWRITAIETNGVTNEMVIMF
jgi:CUB domain